MWVTPELHRLGEGVATARAWGFEPVDEIIWEKPNIGMGVFPRHVHEPLLICRRGNLPFTGPRNIRSVQKWSQRHAGNGGGKVHSAKPDAALDLIEQVSPAPTWRCSPAAPASAGTTGATSRWAPRRVEPVAEQVARRKSPRAGSRVGGVRTIRPSWPSARLTMYERKWPSTPSASDP
jgi:hypothetical protein